MMTDSTKPTGEDVRICSKCRETKPINDFTKKLYYCRPCMNSYMRAYKANHRKPRKLQGFAALPKKKQQLINELMKTKLPVTSIAKIVEINHNTLFSWKRKGVFDTA